jgi:hypothetical protein
MLKSIIAAIILTGAVATAATVTVTSTKVTTVKTTKQKAVDAGVPDAGMSEVGANRAAVRKDLADQLDQSAVQMSSDLGVDVRVKKLYWAGAAHPTTGCIAVFSVGKTKEVAFFLYYKGGAFNRIEEDFVTEDQLDADGVEVPTEVQK